MVELPWGASVQVQLVENVGASIIYYGIFDKIVPEVIWRLLEPGETGVDIGANIGQNTSAMAFKSGTQGRVIAFEPHPVTFSSLRRNVASWQGKNCAPIDLNNVALGEADQEAVLASTGYLSGASLTNQGEGIKVLVRRLDDFAKNLTIGVCKIDVEGHELGVLKGAIDTLTRRAIRDIVFEDFNSKPSPVTEFLVQHGFTIFELHDKLMKPILAPMDLSGAVSPPGFSFNYLATLDPERTRSKFTAGGWHCLTCRRHN